MDHRIYLVIYNHAEQGLLGVHADGSSEEARELAWKLMQDEAMLGREVVDNGIADIPEHGLRQLCLGIEGTPALVVGSTLVPGAVDLATLERLVAEARSGTAVR